MAELNSGTYILDTNRYIGTRFNIGVNTYFNEGDSAGFSTGSELGSISFYNGKIHITNNDGDDIVVLTKGRTGTSPTDQYYYEILTYFPNNPVADNYIYFSIEGSTYSEKSEDIKNEIWEIMTALELKLTDENMLNAIKYSRDSIQPDEYYPPVLRIRVNGEYEGRDTSALDPYWNKVSYSPITNNPIDLLTVGFYDDQRDIGHGFSRFWVYQVNSKTTGQTLWSKSDAETTDGYYWENLSPPDVVVKYDEGGQYLEITNNNPDGSPFYGLVYRNGGVSADGSYGLELQGKKVEKYYIRANNLNVNIPDAYTVNRVFYSKGATRWYSELSATVQTYWMDSNISFTFDPVNGIITASQTRIGSIKTFTVTTTDGKCEQIDKLNWHIIASGTYTCSVEDNYNYKNTITGQTSFTIVAALDTPVLNYDYESNQLEWKAIENATEYQIVLNGEVIDTVNASAFRLLIEEEEKKAKWRVINV